MTDWHLFNILTYFLSLSGDAFFKAAISMVSDVPRNMELDGKHRSSESFLVDYLSNFVSTLLVVPVINIVIDILNRYFGLA